jgi:pimeloyl-ACP methyl ester carboxylesterase
LSISVIHRNLAAPAAEETSLAQPFRIDRERARTAVRHAAGLAELAGRVGSEITALVEEVHAASNPLSPLTRGLPERGVYRAVRLGFTGAGRLAALGGRLAGEPEPDAWLEVQSALNGAFGQLFAEWRSGFALPMSLHGLDGPEPRGPLVVFLHGLCMSERGWRNPAHARFAAWASERLDARVAYLRYNTGLRISANAARLAELLERRAPERELILVGHSMGGLVALGALHHAEARGFAWSRRVTRVACLGSPHEGAPLERLGNHANRLLRVSPWTRPFMRLGNLRSDGIRDLRFGHVLEEDWRDRATDDPRRVPSAVRLVAHADHLLIAAARSALGEADPLGDWMVPVASALARNLHPERAARRVLIPELDHVGLLADERVYRVLRSWLGDRG